MTKYLLKSTKYLFRLSSRRNKTRNFSRNISKIHTKGLIRMEIQLLRIRNIITFLNSLILLILEIHKKNNSSKKKNQNNKKNYDHQP